MPGQYLEIPMPWAGGDFVMAFCPICGAKLLQSDDDQCAHLLFTFLDETGEFEKVSKSISTLVSQVRDFDPYSDDDHPAKQLVELVPSNSAVCFNFEADDTGGAISVCIDFAT